MRDWADGTETGDRDDLTPGCPTGHDRRCRCRPGECLGASKCAYGAECFAEMARARQLSEVVVTNHALLAIDAIEGAPVCRSTRC